jgi:Mn-containing catalase
MFIHKSVLLHDVKVQNRDPVFAEKLLEQYGGATGELSAALTYLTQSYHTDNLGIRDMLQDIGTEELGHLEIIAMLIEQHTAGGNQNLQDKAYRSTLFAIREPGPHLVDSKGLTWDARYVNEGGHTVRDLRANLAAEAGALNTYEQLIAVANDDGTREALVHLATREVAHTHMFMEALKTLNALEQPQFGDLKPDDTVNLYFNMSSGPDAEHRGPWNSEPAFKYVANPLQHEMQEHGGKSWQSNEMEVPTRGSNGNSQTTKQ